MLAYTTIGTNDLEGSIAFYDEIFGLLGAKRANTTERMALWGAGPGQPLVGVCTPWDEKPATVGNGTMPALQAESKEVVDAVHAKALSLGAADEGAPGVRGGGMLYIAYFRDLDGNKLAVATFVGG